MAMRSLSDVPWRPPQLTGERVLLRPWRAEDEEAVFAYASDERVTPYMAWDRHTSRADSHFFLHELVAANYRTEQLDYAICLAAEPDVAVGGMGIYLRSLQHRTAELGYVLSCEQWGKGLVPEAGRLLIGHVFRTTDVERIYAPIFGENVKSRRAAEKMGMTLDGVLRSSVFVRGVRRDEAIFSVLRSEWPERSRA
jgi:ribosomal-protein-alanine N-acetyltransferase